MKTAELKARHLAAWTRALREMLPEGVKSVFDLPPAESNLIAVEAALKSGWFTDPPDGDDWPGEMTYNELDALAVEVWTAWKDATVIDPKS